MTKRFYSLRREPQRFKNTKFFIDKFHSSNHVGCSLGYHMASYSENESINSLNSQVCEQANRDLRRLSTPVSFMSPTNVILHTKVFLALRNLNKKIDGFEIDDY